MRQVEQYGRYVLGYKCSCGWTAGPYDSYGMYNVPAPTFAWHDCCPDCGKHKNDIEQVAGRYLIKKESVWFFFTKETRKFIPKGAEV